MKISNKGKKSIPFGALRRGLTLAMAAAPYVTPTKLMNLIHCEWEKKRRIVKPRSFPYIAIIDITNMCVLHCPYCPTGQRRYGGRRKGMIDPLKIRRLIDQTGKYLVSANLFNWGEPLLHPQIIEIVNMFNRARIFTSISTNLNINDKNLLKKLCESGLDYLTISLSGTSQEVYEQYHRGGNLELVLENTRHISEMKRIKHLKKPIVEWKYLVFKHNRHEVNSARRLAEKAGVDIFRNVRGGGAEESIVEDGDVPEGKVPVKFCHQLWHVILISSDGGIAPCCYLYYKEDDFGEFQKNNITDIRHNNRFITARKLFNTSSVADLPSDLQHPCLKCTIVHEQPHLRNYLELNPHAKKGHRTGGP